MANPEFLTGEYDDAGDIDTPELETAFQAIWERISGAEAEGVCHG